MTIDEKIKQAAEAFGNKRARMQCSSGCEHTDKVWQRHLKVGAEDGFIAGTEAMRSEMLADMQKLAEALSDMNSWLSRMSELRWDDPSHAPRFKKSFNRNLQALSEFNAKYKEQK